MQETDVFEQIYRQYLNEVSHIDLHRVKDRLGLEVKQDAAIIPFFEVPFRVSAHGILDDRGQGPHHSVSVILCKYLLMSPPVDPTESDWVTYKDFKDAAPFVIGFRNTAEKPIGDYFSDRLSELERACRQLGGRPAEIGVSSDLLMRIHALPRVPLLLLFNDRDEDFAAQCTLLFEKRAEKYLDIECLAMTGMVLAGWLKRCAGVG